MASLVSHTVTSQNSQIPLASRVSEKDGELCHEGSSGPPRPENRAACKRSGRRKQLSEGPTFFNFSVV